MKSQLILALDIDKSRSIYLVDRLCDYIKIYKIGHRLFTSDPDIIHYINKKGCRVLIDLKYHDIPTVVGLAVNEIITKYNPFGITMHTSGGKKMLETAVEIKNKFPAGIKPVLFGVTVLTSLAITDFKLLFSEINDTNPDNVNNVIKNMAVLAKKTGLDGIVCSGNEIRMIKQALGEEFLTLVPGLKITDSSSPVKVTDQKRVYNLSDAIKDNGDYLVAGRYIYDSSDPVKTVKELLHLLNSGLQ